MELLFFLVVIGVVVWIFHSKAKKKAETHVNDTARAMRQKLTDAEIVAAGQWYERNVPPSQRTSVQVLTINMATQVLARCSPAEREAISAAVLQKQGETDEAMRKEYQKLKDEGVVRR